MSESISAPLPPDLASRSRDPLGDAALRPTHLRVIRDRNFAFIPSFYEPHANPAATTVTQQGVPIAGARGKLSFTVADVAPERRWAITESGEVLPQHLFEGKLLLYRDEWFTQVAQVKPPGDLSKEFIPTVERFVRKTVDPVDPSRLIEIGFDPNARPDESIERRLWDAKGEESVSGDERMRLLQEAYHSPRLFKTLKTWEVEEVERHMAEMGATPARGGGDLVAKLEELNAMLAAGDITSEVHSRRVALLTGVPMPTAPAAPEAPRRRSGYSKAPCGAEVANLQKRRHRESCPECVAKSSETAA